jgi:hypothetical protein
MAQTVDDTGLDTFFRDARSYTKWQFSVTPAAMHVRLQQMKLIPV